MCNFPGLSFPSFLYFFHFFKNLFVFSFNFVAYFSTVEILFKSCFFLFFHFILKFVFFWRGGGSFCDSSLKVFCLFILLSAKKKLLSVKVIFSFCHLRASNPPSFFGGVQQKRRGGGLAKCVSIRFHQC